MELRPISFREFMLEQPDWKFKEYQKRFGKTELRIFFEDHCEEEWLKERHHPVYLGKQIQQIEKEARDRLSNFLTLFANNPTQFNLDRKEEAGGRKEAKESEAGGDVASGRERREKAEEPERDGDDKSEEKSEEEGGEGPAEPADADSAAGGPPPEEAKALFVKAIPPNLKREELESLFGSLEGFDHLELSDPQPAKKFFRLCWAFYSTPEQASAEFRREALAKTENKKIGEFTLSVILHHPTGQDKPPRFASPIFSQPDQIVKDEKKAAQLVKLMDKEKGLENTLFENRAFVEADVKQKLDVLVCYLRAVHFYCYYSGVEASSLTTLVRRTGSGSYRQAAREGEEPSERETRYLHDLQAKHDARLTRSPDTALLTAVLLQEKWTEQWREDHCVKLDAERYRCAFCSKLFKGDNFVFKHLSLKHGEKEEEIREKAVQEQYWRNFDANPPRLAQPGANLPPSRSFRGRGGGGGGGGGGGAGRFEREPRDRERSEREPRERAERGDRRGSGGRGERRGRGGGPGGGGPGGGFRGGRPGPLDPRAGSVFSYHDLDAPTTTLPEIDYRTALNNYESMQKE